MYDAKEIGKRLQRFRISKGLSQDKMSELIGISERQYRRYELGDSNIPMATVIELLNMGMDINYLYSGKVDLDIEIENALNRMPDNKYKAVVRDIHIVAKDYNDTGQSDKLILLLENILEYGAVHKEDALRRKIKFDFFTCVYEKEF